MPKLVELTAFDVPEYVAPERSPSKIVPCPYCSGFHVVPRTTRYVSLKCAAGQADVTELMDAGEAPQQLVTAFVSGEPLPPSSDLWRLQPTELYEQPEYISQGLAAHLNAVDL